MEYKCRNCQTINTTKTVKTKGDPLDCSFYYCCKCGLIVGWLYHQQEYTPREPLTPTEPEQIMELTCEICGCVCTEDSARKKGHKDHCVVLFCPGCGAVVGWVVSKKHFSKPEEQKK